ncbi:MAG: GNAT family N-acetyltransferase, partial [Candidatus Thorarchaeota archaeon]
IPPAFKLTHHCHPRDLDIVLDAMGFNKEMETYVQTKALPFPSDNGGKLSARISTEMDQEWIDAYSKLGMFESLTLQCRLEIINRIESMKGFARVEAQGEIIGIGMGVLQDEMLGLFGIVTEPMYRRKGVGMSVNAALMDWGKCNGAKTAYLQVEKQNKPAIALYAKCGFEICYDYWYRILRS